MDELLLAVARFHISSEDNQGSVGTVSKLFFAQQEACKEHITQYLMRNMIHQFKRIVFHLNLSLLTIEVPQFDEALQALLEQEGFTETGGYLAEHIGMMFKFSVRMEGDDKGLLHVLPAPSDLNEATPFPQSDVVVNMEEEEDNNQDEDDVDNLDTLLDSLDVNQVENLKQEENMTNLIDSLFTALHRHDIQPEST